MSIYVEILVRAPMDALWAHTQTPALHEKWDLHFSRINYLPISHETEPQRFRYTTRIGFGLEVSGEGEPLGQRTLTDGSCSSALRFASGKPLSIIREGSGYWKYIPTLDEAVYFFNDRPRSSITTERKAIGTRRSVGKAWPTRRCFVHAKHADGDFAVSRRPG